MAMREKIKSQRTSSRRNSGRSYYSGAEEKNSRVVALGEAPQREEICQTQIVDGGRGCSGGSEVHWSARWTKLRNALSFFLLKPRLKEPARVVDTRLEPLRCPRIGTSSCSRVGR